MNRAKRVLAVLLGLAMVIFVMSACGKDTAAVNEGSAGAAGTTLQSKIDPNDVYYVVCAFDQLEFFNAHKMAWAEAGKMFNVQTKWVGIAGGDVTEFVNLLNTTIAKNPAGLVVFGLDESAKPSIDHAVELGIPTMTWESDIVTSNRDTWIGSNGHDLGYTGGKLYAEYLKGTGKIAILTMPGLEMYDSRAQGYRDAFASYPGIEVVAEGDTKTDEAVAVQAAKNILTAHPDLTGFVCTDATGPMGAVTAISEAGLTGKVQVLGLDRDTALLQRIKSGEVFGSVVQNDVTMLQWALFDLIMGKYNSDALLTTDNKAACARLLPNSINSSINLITPDNVDYYLEANQKFADYVKSMS
jgi:ABC-type sugar transport system substrate-binding protein